MVTITIQATIGAGTAAMRILNQGTFSYDSNEDNTNDASGLTDDPNVPGLSDPTAFLVASSGMADLAVSKTNHQSDSVPGQTTTYKIVVSNSGPSNAVGAVVTDIFDAAKFDTSAIRWTCDAAAPPGGATGCPLSGDGDNLAAGVSVNIGVLDAVSFSGSRPRHRNGHARKHRNGQKRLGPQRSQRY